MHGKTIEKFAVLFLALIGTTVFVLWFVYNPVKGFKASIPGLDNRPKHSSDANTVIKIGQKYTFLKEYKSTLTGKWPHFRGADYDNINKENIKLIDHFGKEGPKIL